MFRIDRMRHILIVTAILAALGCAETGPPPGGPEDKSGPSVVLASPVNGAVNQFGLRAVRLDFSERVTVPAQGSSVYISPRPIRPPRISWGSRSLKIEFADTLAANRTYVISIPGVLADLHGNKPDTAISLAFSTGPTLDSGRIAGQVFADGKALPGLSVALYEANRFNLTGPIDSIYADYLTMTGLSGEFQFTNLPAGQFRLLAYQKSGRDERFRPNRQKFALPDREISVGGTVRIDQLTMSLTTQDTMPVKISSAAVSANGVVLVKLSSPVRRSEVEKNSSALTVSIGEKVSTPLALMPEDSELVTSVQAWCGPLPQGIGAIKWALVSGQLPVTYDSLKVAEFKDTTRPRVLAVFPTAEPLLTADTAVHVRFSEPLDTTRVPDSSVLLKSVKDSAIVQTKRSWVNPFEMVLRPDSLKSGVSYSVLIFPDQLRDLSANLLGDSIAEYTFSIFPADSLGWIDGTTGVSLAIDSTAEIGLTFRRIIDSRRFHWYGKRGALKVALPGGKYMVTGYLDRNANRRFDPGTIFPLSLAETQLRYVDTVAVRARFETAGVELEFK